MSPYVLLFFVLGYFLLLLGVAWYTSRNSNNESFLSVIRVRTGCLWLLE